MIEGFKSDVGHAATSNIVVAFSDHFELVELLCETSDAVVGCVAWLTCERCLAALSKLPHGCSIVVHHDDGALCRSDVLAAYEACKLFDPLKLTGDDYAFSSIVAKEDGSSRAMMHHKFLVGIVMDGENQLGTPSAVWCGSANLTKNSTRGMDHSMIVTEPSIVRAFYSEYLNASIYARDIG